MSKWRLIKTPPSTGAWNMAVGEAILENIYRGEVEISRCVIKRHSAKEVSFLLLFFVMMRFSFFTNSF
jgi:hypothetical protein